MHVVRDTAFTSSPFVTAIEPITETDDEIRAFLEEAELPPLLPALAYLTGDLSLLTRRPPARAVAGRRCRRAGCPTISRPRSARSRSARLTRFRDDGCRPAPPARRRAAASDHGVRGRRRRHGPVPAAARGGARVPRRGPPGAHVEQGGRRARRPVPCRRDRCGHVGSARRAPPEAGRRVVRRDREGRRRRRHVAREHVSRMPRRQPEPQLQLLLRAAPRLAAALLDPGRAARLLPTLRGGLRPPRAHSIPYRGALRDVVGRRARLDRAHARRRRQRRIDCRERGDQCGRSAQPAAPPRHPGTRVVHGACVPLGALGPFGRPARQRASR